MAFNLSSPAFAEGGPIPKDYTCDGADQTLPVAWSGVPEGTAELALIMDDPDARGFVHWVVVGIPPTAMGIEGDGTLPAGARLGTTVTGECLALHRGRTTMVWQTTLRNEAGKLCSVVTQTQLVLD